MKVRDFVAPKLNALWRAVPIRYREPIQALAREVRDDRVTGLAAEIAFFAVLSAFPWLLLLTAATGWFASLGDAGLAVQVKNVLVNFLNRVLTEEASGAVTAVRNVFEQERIGVISASALVAAWTSTRGFAAAIAALNLAYDSEERRSWLRLRLVALALALGSVVLGAVLLVVFVAGPMLGRGRAAADLLGVGNAFVVAWQWARWPLAIVVLVAGAALIYRIAPCRSYPWRQHLVGAAVAAGFGAIASAAFSIYLRIAAAGNPVYGALGGGLALLVWMYLLALGLLIGAETNGVLRKRPHR